MSVPFDIDVYDHDVFDCGDIEPTPEDFPGGPSRISLTSVPARSAQIQGALAMIAGLINHVHVGGTLRLSADIECGCG